MYNRTKKIAVILEAEIEQAISIAKYLKFYGNFKTIGVTKEFLLLKPRFFDSVLHVKQYTPRIFASTSDIVIPAGAISTWKFVSEMGNFCLGEACFTKNSLVVYNKIEMLKIAQKLNIPIPETYNTSREIKEFPVFFKAAHESGGIVPRGIAKTPKDIPRNFDLIFQRPITGNSTFGVGFIAKEGKISDYFIYEEILSWPYTGGTGVILKSFYDPKLLEYTQRLLKEINFSGWGLAEFKFSPSENKYFFMEVNGKFWASIEFAFVNNPAFLKKLFGIEISFPKTSCMLFLDRLVKLKWVHIVNGLKFAVKNRCKIVTNTNIITNYIMAHFPSIGNSLRKGVVKCRKKTQKYSHFK